MPSLASKQYGFYFVFLQYFIFYASYQFIKYYNLNKLIIIIIIGISQKNLTIIKIFTQTQNSP